MEVRFPEVSKEDPNTEGVVATWFVTDGESVLRGQLLAEVQVDKVTAEVNAPASGAIKIIIPEQAVVVQSAVIAYIE